MPVDHIRFDLLAQEALRGVVRRVLIDAAKKGLPGEHHFFISFDTRAPGVRISDRLRAQHPEEMTIVLQHQFWDLTVAEHAFEVGLSFNGIPERLLVPFDALKGFFDPSVQFGLQFDTAQGAAEAAPPPPKAEPVKAGPAKAGTAKAKPSALPESLRKLPAGGNENAEAPVRPKAAETDGPADAPEPPPSGGAEVVRLDRFRKK